MDKDKIILVVYAGLNGISIGDRLQYLSKIADFFSERFDESVMAIVMPDQTEETSRIECINPKLVTEEVYKEALDVVERAKKYMDELEEKKDES